MRIEPPIYGHELLMHVSLEGGVSGSGELQKGTNDKRVLSSRTESDLKSRKEQLSFDDCNKQQAFSKSGQRFSAWTLEKSLRRGRTLSPQGLHARSVEHEVSAMFGRSPGLPGKHLRKEVISLEDVTGISGVPLPDSKRPENEESTDSYENEGSVVSVKRIKPNTGQKLKQHNSDIDALSPDTRELNAYAHGNADENDKSESQRDASKNEKTLWSAYLRYYSMQNSLPDYRDPEHPSPAAAKSAGARPMKAPIPSGLKPINRLRGETPTVVPSQRKPSQDFPFNLHEGYDRRPPHKKRKTGGDSMGNAFSANEVIDVDVDDDTAPSQRNGEPSSAISGRSHTQNGYSTNSRSIGGGVEEFNRVEHMMNPRAPRKTKIQTNGTSWDSQITAASKSNRLQKLVATASSVVRLDGLDLDDPNDPISDADKPSSQPASKPKLQVIISGYKGSANRAPARSKPNVRNVAHSRQFSAYDESKSRYFPSAINDELSRQINSELNGTQKATTRQQNRNSDQNAQLAAKHQDDNEHEIDDLSVAHYSDHRTAQILLHQQHQSRAAPPSGKSKEPRFLDESSEDDVIALKQSNIKPSAFQNSGKTSTKEHLEENLVVLQIFSDSEVWLSRDSKINWSLLFDLENITIRSESGRSVLDTTINSIIRVEYNENDASMVVHKSRDENFGRASKFCLTLGSNYQREVFVEKIRSHPRIKANLKQSNYLERVFSSTCEKAKLLRSKCELDPEPAEDVQLAMKKTADRLSKHQDKMNRTRGTRVIDQLGEDDHESPRESGGLAGSEKMQSSSDLIEIQEPRRSSKRQKIAVNDFYGDSIAENQVKQPALRSSARLSGQVSPPKKRTPSPERWTESNPGWGGKWKSSIVYPRVGKEKATVDKQDIERLDEGQFLNDNLIEFYIRWLESHLVQENPDLAKRIYFHNTFFYNRLTTNVRGKKGINYEAVERWTAKIDLLSYDYIVVPVNENYHWYVAIICNAPRLLNLEPGTEAQSPTREDGAIEDGQIKDTRTKNRSSATALSSTPPVRDLDEVGIPIEEIPLQDKKEDQSQNKSRADASTLLAAKESGGDIPTSTSNRENDTEKALSSDPVSNFMDLSAAPLQKGAPFKKIKRKSHTAPRKYNPSDPRIITLDSLGLKHSPTCTNLKEYLIAEIKSKRGIDIPSPGSLGMTATSIPEQDNFCDCGLFLLSYVEMFLKQPEKFIHGILQLQDVKKLFSPWPRASEMRESMRKLLLDLQAQQVAEESEKQKPGKTKGKKEEPLEYEQQANTLITTRIPKSHKSVSKPMAEIRSAVNTNTPGLVSNHSSQETSIESGARRERRPISKEFPKTSGCKEFRSKSSEQYLRAVSSEPEGEFCAESAGTIDDSQAAPAEGGNRASVDDFVENCGHVEKVPEDHRWKEQVLSGRADPYKIHGARPLFAGKFLQRSIETSSRDLESNETMSRSLDRDTDAVEVASSSVRDREKTSYSSRVSLGDGDNQDWTRNVQSFQAKADNVGGKIDPHKNPEEFEGTDEDEMLLPNGASAQPGDVQNYNPRLLSDFKLSSPNVSSHRNTSSSSLAASTSSRKRKDMADSIRLEDSHSPRYLLDSSDQAIVEGHTNVKA